MVHASKAPRSYSAGPTSPMVDAEVRKTTRHQHKGSQRKLRVGTSTSNPDLSDQSAKEEALSATSTSLTLVPTPVDGHRRDSFGAYPIEVHGCALKALDEQISLLGQEEIVLEVRGGKQHPMLTAVFRSSLQDVGLFTCFLTAALGFYEQRRSTGSFHPSDEMVRIQSRGLKNIYDRIMQPKAEDDDELIAAILQLMVADAVSGNTRSLISHQRGVRKMIAMRGGLGDRPLNQATMGLLMVIEFYVALAQFLSPTPTSPPPTENALRYIKHPFPASLCLRLAKLPHGLQNLVLSGKLSLQSIKLLDSVSDWSVLLDSVAPDAKGLEQTYGRLFAEPMECSRSAVFILRHLQQANSQLSIEYLVCLGVVVAIKHSGRTKKVDTLDDQLLDVFINTVKRFIYPDPVELEVTIWLVAVVAWRTMANYEAHAKNIIDFILDTYEDMRDLEHVQALWEKFLWYQKFSDAWSQHWQDGLDRHRKRSPPKLLLSLPPISRSVSADDKVTGGPMKQLTRTPSSDDGGVLVQPRFLDDIKKEESGDSLLSLGSSVSLARSATTGTTTSDSQTAYSDDLNL